MRPAPVIGLVLLAWQGAFAQTVLMPFIGPTERTMAFVDGRFVEVDPRPSSNMHVLGDALLFQDHAGALIHYAAVEGRRTVLETRAPDELHVAGTRAAWRMGDTLKVLRAGAGVTVATGVGRFEVSDSLLVAHDSVAHELLAFWRGQRFTIAEVAQGSERPQWSLGGNSLVVYDRGRGVMELFHRGVQRVLADSIATGLVVTGTDLVAHWDDAQRSFMAHGPGHERVLSGLRPVSAQAGRGIVAWVDGTLKLRVWDGAQVTTLTDSMPARYWVQDDHVVYHWQGRTLWWSGGELTEVEAYVPEQWQLSGDRFIYLDINRELRAIHKGKRSRLGNEAAITSFSAHGEAVLYTSPAGPITIHAKGRTYTY